MIKSKSPRKNRLQWMESRLRRLRCTKQADRTDRQKERIFELEQAIALLRP